MKTFSSGIDSDTNPADLPPSEARYMPNMPATLQITNLTVKDLGDIVEASFQSEGCRVVVQIPKQPLQMYTFRNFTYLCDTAEYIDSNLRSLVESYLKST